MRFDDDDVSSELYRLMPPPVGDPIIVVSPDIKAPRWPLRLAQSLLKCCKANIGQVIILIVSGVIVAIIVTYMHL